MSECMFATISKLFLSNAYARALSYVSLVIIPSTDFGKSTNLCINVLCNTHAHFKKLVKVSKT